MIGLTSRAPGRPFLPVPPALFVVCLTAAAAGCNAAAPDAGDRLRDGFPKYAAGVLERGSALARTDRGFQAIETVASSAARASASRVQTRGGVALPLRGKDPIVLSPRDAAEIQIHEVGLAGHGKIVDRAVAYPIPGGTSYWTATSAGAEEWLLFEPGVVQPGRAAAIWEVAGATPVQRGNTVALYTEQGRRLVTVTAPAAFLADGTHAPVRLSVRGASIELFVETAGQGVLVDPSWSYVASMNEPRLGHTAARLTSGNVVVAGGETLTINIPQAVGGVSSANAAYTSESYDPFFDQWSFLPDMFDGHIEHAMVTQPAGGDASGGVFVIAGRNDFGSFLSLTEYFDGNSWQLRPDLFEARAAHTGTRLQDDRVLVAGGYNDCGGGSGAAEALAKSGGANGIGSGFCFLCTAEVYDPSASSGNGDWIGTGQLNFCRALHSETLLDDGTVIVAGGENGGSPMTSVEKWSPMTGQWAEVAPMNTQREYHTATRLMDGKVLVVGGTDGGFPLDTAELYDPGNDTWTTVGPMQAPHAQHAAVLLNDGTVLLTGGYNFNGASPTTEIYDPATQQFSLTVDMNDFRARHTETLLADGSVLVAGGDNFFGDPPITESAEIFTIIGGIGQPCGQNAECQSAFCVDGVCCNSACDSPCEACTDNARGGGGEVLKVVAKGGGASAVFQGGSGDGKGGGSGSGDGFCGPVFQGADPADDCADLDPSSCATSGACDGFGACEIFPANTICQFPDCMGTVALGGGLCDGAGTCVTEALDDCEPYLCDQGVCASSCLDQPDCSAFAFCDGVIHTCAPKKDDGAVAFDPVQCQSGFVADGVCCDEACDKPCHSCAAQTGAAADGTCSPVSGFQCNDGDACTQIDSCQDGVCVGGTPVDCPGDTGCQGGLACDSKTGGCDIPTPPKNTGDACNDGASCTTADVCTAAGDCLGTGVVCTPGECQIGGACAEGKGCEFDSKADFTACTKDNNACTIEWCIDGACVANNATDLSPCPGGVCFGGSCVPDGSLVTTGAGAGGPGGGGSGGNGQGAQGGGGNDPAGGSAATGGSGGNSAANGDEPAFKLEGAGCATAPAGSSSTSGWAGAALALLGLFGVKRRRSSRRA